MDAVKDVDRNSLEEIVRNMITTKSLGKAEIASWTIVEFWDVYAVIDLRVYVPQSAVPKQTRRQKSTPTSASPQG
jgi:hypothetical protein